MKTTPSYLKGLGDKRRRAAGDIERLERLVGDLEEQIAKARAVMAACDVLILEVDKRMDLAELKPIRGVTRYGKRGSLVQAILAELRKADGKAITTIELGVALQARFGLDFVSWEERRRWVKNSVTPALKDMVAAGQVERLHDPESKSGETGRWRLASGEPAALGEIATRSHRSGGSVRQADAED